MEILRTLQQPFRLIYMILRYGRLKARGVDFAEERERVLSELQSFVPSVPRRPRIPFWFSIREHLTKNSILRNLIIQLDLLKEAIRLRGGHLHVPFLNISYIRIPKAASTSLSMMVLQEIYPGLRQVPLNSTDINYLTDANLRRHISPADPLDVFFTVVRNPYARIVSVYRDFFENADKPFVFEDYLFGIFSRDLSFHQFVERLSDVPDFLREPHLRQQHHFIDFYIKRIPNIIVLKLEDKDQLTAFCTLYDLEMPHLNASEPYDFRSYYDNATFQRVTKMYRADLKRFNYANEVRSLRTWLKKP